MTDSARSQLFRTLEAGYQTFWERLRRRLGSDALATEALHETWLRIGRMGDASVVQRPESYVFRMALNAASDRRKVDDRRLSPAEIEAARHMMDDALDPEHIVQVREEMALLQAALMELPPRRRAIFLLARVEEVKQEDIARQFGISTRMVEKHVFKALQYCSERLGKTLIRRFGSGGRKPS